MNTDELYLGQFFQIHGLASYYGVITKLNKKTVVIEYNLSGREIVDKLTLQSKRCSWARFTPIHKDNVELQKIALNYCTFTNIYANSDIDYIYKLDQNGLFKHLKG